MLNGVIAALVAITAACGVRRAVGGDRDRLRLRRDRRRRRDLRRGDRHRRPDRRGRRARHVRRLGHARLRLPHGADAWRRTSPPARAAWSTRAASTSSASRRSASRPSARSRSRCRSSILWVLKKTFGHPRRRGGRRRPVSTSPSTACGATPSSTSRSRAATAPSRTGIWPERRTRQPVPPAHRLHRRDGRGALGPQHGVGGGAAHGPLRPASRRRRPAAGSASRRRRPAVSSPSKRRTSESSTKTFRNCGSSSPSKIRSRSDG